MTSTLIPISDEFAAAVSIILMLLTFKLIWGRPAFLAALLIFIICRLISTHDFLLLDYSQAWLGAFGGALKDMLPLAPFLLLIRFRSARFLGALAATGILLLNIIDTVYIKETFSRLQHELLENTDFTSIFIRLDFFAMGLAAIGFGLLLFLPLFLKLERKKPKIFSHGLFILICAVCMLFDLSPQIPKTNDYLTDEINMERNFSLVIISKSAVRNFMEEGLWPAPGNKRPAYSYTDDEFNLLKSWGVFDHKQANPRAEPAYERVIYIFIESLSFDFLSSKVLKPGACLMPFYFSLLNNPGNIYLSNYYSSAFTTDEGIYAAFASRPDFGGDDAAGRRMENIFSMARQEGYKSAYFLGASVHFRSKFKTYVNTMQVDEVYGLEQTMGLPSLNHSFPWGDTDERIFEKALLWLKENREEKSISIICTINTHPPFFSKDGPPPDVEDTPLTRAFYSTDRALENFIKSLEEAGVLDEKTLLIISADHQITHGGEMAREHLPGNKFGNRRIPLVLISKNIAPLQGIQKDALASAIDMAPTLGDLMGFPEQPGYYGKSLFIPNRRYDLAITRGGLFFFGNEDMKFSFDLRYNPEGLEQNATYKWYFNRQQHYSLPENDIAAPVAR